MTDANTLLRDYAERRSEVAFRELVTRYVNFVYSTAFRLVGGDAQTAEDVVQMVFTDLALKPPSLKGRVMLGGWLHRRTCNVAATLMRSERRRRLRERRVVEMNALQNQSGPGLAQIAPALDETINQLDSEDRQAILLRFFEQQDCSRSCPKRPNVKPI